MTSMLRRIPFGLLLMAISALPGRATELYEVQITPGAPAVPLPFDGWLGTAGSVYTILEPPAFGALDPSEIFHPSQDFWAAGSDSFRVLVEPPERAPVFEAVVLLTPARLSEQSYTNDFEGGQVPPPSGANDTEGSWHREGNAFDFQFVPGLAGSTKALQIEAPPGGSASIHVFIDPDADGENSVGALGNVEVLPPPFTDPESIIAFVGTQLESAGFTAGQILLEARYAGGSAWDLRARVQDCEPGAKCETDWIPILPGEAHFDLWAGPKRLGHPVAVPSSLRFTVSQDGISTTHWLDEVGADTTRTIDFGAIDTDQIPGVRIVLDDATLITGTTRSEQRGHLLEDFEEAAIGSAWQEVGPVAITQSSAIAGAASMVTDLNAGPAYLVDTTPAAATTLTAGLTLDLGDLQLAVGDSAKIFGASGNDSPTIDNHLAVVLRKTAAGHQIRGRILDDHGTFHPTPWVTLPFLTHRLTFAWASGDGDGFLRLFVDKDLATELTSLATGAKRIESVRFGVYGITLGGVGGQAQPVLWDDLVSAF